MKEMRRSLLFKSLIKALLIFTAVYMAVRVGDFLLTFMFASVLPTRGGNSPQVTSCPKFGAADQQQISTRGGGGGNAVMQKHHHDKILKDPSQFAAEESNLPYLVESYRTSSLANKVVKTLTHPVDVPCRSLERFGLTEPGGHDGHLVCMDVVPSEDKKDSGNNKCLVYSFGVGYDFSFEDQIIKRGCDVHSFDPSMIFMDHVRGEGVNFHRLGLHDENSDDYAPFLGGYIKEPQIWRVRTLDSILESLGHEKRNITILKIDIEGSEWPLIEYLLFEKPQLLHRIDQFIVEWHIGARQQKQIDAIYQLAQLWRKCSGFSLVYADHWRRDSQMHALLTTYVNSRLVDSQTASFYKKKK